MRLWPIVRKDLLHVARDPIAAVLLLAAPLVLVAALGASTGKLLGWSARNEALRLEVVDLDGGPLARAVAAGLAARPGLDVVETPDERAAVRRVSAGERMACVVIGPAFSRDVAALGVADLLDGSTAHLASLLDWLDVHVRARRTRAASAAVVRQLVLGEVLRSVAPWVAARDPLAAPFLRAPAGAPPLPAPAPSGRDDVDAAGEGRGEIYEVLVPSYTVMFLFFIVNIMARSLLEERALGTMQRLRAAPISAAALLAAKSVPFLLTAVVQGVLLFAAGKVLFGMSWGERPWLLLPVLLATALAATALGVLVSTLVRSEAQVAAFSTLLVVGLGAVSGCFLPRVWLPEALRQASLATPHAWALIAFDQVLMAGGPDVSRVMTCCGVLVAMAAVFSLAGWQRFRKAG